MHTPFAAWLFAVSFGASALGGMLGMAGGIFLVPMLTLLGHVELRAAIGASLVAVIACSCSSAAAYLEGRLTNIRLAVVLEVATTLGALSGVLLSGFIPATWLYFLFAAILFVSAQQMMARRSELAEGSAGGPAGAQGAPADSWAQKLSLHSTYPERASAVGDETPYRVRRLPLGLVLMYGAGLISALLGIGSGVLKIPAMDSALRLPLKVSSATSSFMIGVTASASACAYFARGEISAALAGPVALGSIAGSLLGAQILMRSSSSKLRVFFVVVLVLLGLQMLASALGLHLPGARNE